MPNSLIKIQTPEEIELERKQQEFDSLQTELAQRELDLETLRAELNAFEAQYMRIVGVRYAELDEIEAKIAELQAKAQPTDTKAQQKAQEARERAKESASAAQEAIEHSTGRDFQPSESLKKLFRDLAKQIHPDLANDEQEKQRRHKFMAMANEAYRNGDEARLQEILREWQNSPESVKGQGVAVELVRLIRKIALARQRLVAIDTEIDQLKSTDLYELREQVNIAKQSNRDLLGEMANRIESDIRSASNKLEQVRIGR